MQTCWSNPGQFSIYTRARNPKKAVHAYANTNSDNLQQFRNDARVNGRRISLEEYDEFELLWLQYGRELSLSKTAIFHSLQDVQRGILPCDAELLRSRATGFTALSQRQHVQGLDVLRVVNSNRHTLQFDPEYVRCTLNQLLQLLPGSCPTQLLMDAVSDLDLPPEILALQYQQITSVYKAACGSHISPAALHHVLQRWRSSTQHEQMGQHQGASKQTGLRTNTGAADQQQFPGASFVHAQRQQQQQQQQQQSTAAGPRPVEQAAGDVDSFAQQLAALKDLLGAEVMHAAITECPRLLDASPASILKNLQWLQRQLHLSPVAALALVDGAGPVLLLPSTILEARYKNLCFLMLQVMGWRLQQVRTLLCSEPQLLGRDSNQLASNWQLVQQLARRRSMWLEEISSAGTSLMVAVLCAEQCQLQQLRYAADSGDLPGQRLVEVLKKQYTDFVHSCPGFRVWRYMVPSDKHRWSLVESGCLVAADAAHGMTDASGTVLAVDSKGRPVLVQLGALGPGDRLVSCN